MDDPIHVLHVDDDAGFGEVVAEFLAMEDDRIEVHTESDPRAALDRLDESIDCVVSDYQMPEMDGLALLSAVRDRDPELPFLLYTGQGSERVASDAISAGASDYLQKGAGPEQYELLANRIVTVVDRYRAHRELERTGRRLAEIADAAEDVLWTFDADWEELLFVNDAYERVWGRPVEELRREPRSFLDGVHPEDRPSVEAAMERLPAGSPVELTFRVRDGERERHVRVRGSPVEEGGEVVRVVGFVRDRTDQRAARRRAERARARLVAVFGAISRPVAHVVEEDGRPVVEATNDAFESVFDCSEAAGRPLSAVTGTDHEVLVPGRPDEPVTVHLDCRTASGERSLSGVVQPVDHGHGHEWVVAYVEPDDDPGRPTPGGRDDPDGSAAGD